MNGIDFTGHSVFGGSPNGLRISTNPFGGAMTGLPVGEDLPGQARVAEEARPKEATGPKKPRAGLLPMRVGANYAITIKRPAMDRGEAQKRLAQVGRALRKAQQIEAEAKEGASMIVGNDIPREKIEAYVTASNNRAAIGRLYDQTARAAGRNPHEVAVCAAQDPVLMPEAFVDGALPVWICTHERCRGQEWGDHRALVADHPAADLARKGEAHVYGLWSKAPIDADAPVAGVLGLIAPFSADGTPVTKIAQAFADAAEEMPEDGGEPIGAEDVAALAAEAEAKAWRGRKTKKEAAA